MVCHCSTETTGVHNPTPLKCLGNCNDMAVAHEGHPSKSILDFALKLYKSVSKQQENIFFSPLCIHTVLTMVLPGAKKETLEQMKNSLSIESMEDALSGFRDLISHLNSADVSDKVKIGNKIFIEKGLDIVDDYKRVTRDVFQTEYEQVSFSAQPLVARDVINCWVSEITNGKIAEMIKGAFRPLTRLMLVSAVYFKGFWAEKFPKDSTRMLPFHISSKQSVNVKMMCQEMRAGFAISRELKAKVISLPYEKEKEKEALSMIIILPDDVEGLSSIEESLDTLMLNNIMREVRGSQKQVYVELPKFEMEETLNLQPFLSAMGMVDAFCCGEADLTGIVRNDRELHIAEAIQKAYIDVNEEGTEAAAAASTTCVDGATKQFCVDRPFIFLIVENTLNLVLFIGALKNPKASESTEAV